ncbi:unnamed protein product, partial [marine sediment metagenome]
IIKKNKQIFMGKLYQNKLEMNRLELKIIDKKSKQIHSYPIIVAPFIFAQKKEFKLGNALIIGKLKDNIIIPNGKQTIFILVEEYIGF